MGTPDLKSLLDTLSSDVKTTLSRAIAVNKDDDPDLDDIKGAGSNVWLKIPKVVAVVADLKNSSLLGTNKHDTSTAKVYQAGVEGAVKALHEFDADFIDIQGDGGFGLFWGDKAFERAFCSAVTIRTFSEDFVDQLEKSNNDSNELPKTGYKLGIADGRVLVKTIGTKRDVSEQEAVWPGRPVNHAAKCAQSADRHQVITTATVWEHFQNNDYVRYSCGCSGRTVESLWAEIEIEHIHDERFKQGYLLQSPWCLNCGPTFCDAIMSGRTTRSIPQSVRIAPIKKRMREALDNRSRPSYPR